MEEEFGAVFVDRVLQPIEGPLGPCGPDLEQDPEFFQLERAAEGKPETQFSQAVPPNWEDVRLRAESILQRSRDLRAAVLWTRAGVGQHGFRALAQGLRLVHGLLESFWDQLHPLPDEGDPYARMNALALLPDTTALLGDLRRGLLFRSPGVGELRVRDVEVALRLLAPRQGESAPSREQIGQMLADAARTDAALRASARNALSHLQALAGIAASHATADSPPPDWKPLQRLLEGIEGLMLAHVDVAAPATQAVPAQAATAAPAGAVRPLGAGVNSREDALRAIDLVCEFLERTEPTNPAPLFLRRARRLISHSFLELVKELAPEALAEVARVVGVNPDTVTLRDTS